VIEGIDVSAHQPRVDWAAVRKAGIRFAYLKATEGVGFVDPRVSAYAAGAKAARIPRGFYHFARPDTYGARTAANAARDARAEADAFLAIAFPRPGDLLPALDLEVAGLGRKLLAAWARAWLGRVRARIGARPLLYTYPAFWSRLGDARGLRSYPLWIAHWDVEQPSLPPGVRRYAIWQYTSNGRVAGIGGRVDRNRLREGLDLEAITYRPAHPEPQAHNFPGPVPKPGWFWPWLRWRLGTGEFEGLARDPAVRPDEAPASIPGWARASERKLVERRRSTRRT
jgi:GH25 family lysozyme M1 (1,4-beta-N-acetylmuramidase)